MQNIFDYFCYKEFIQSINHRGLYKKLSEELAVNSTLISQIFKGPKELTLEQAYKLSSYLELNSLEGDYFLLLVQKNRAGTADLKNYFEKKLEVLRYKSTQVKNNVDIKDEITNEQKAIYYSHWCYQAVRLLASITEFQELEKIKAFLKLSDHKLDQIVSFLIESKLCKLEDGKLVQENKHTFIPSGSLYVGNHHLNWRQKTLERRDQLDDPELMFTAPLTLAHTDTELVRDMILQFLKELKHIIDQSPGQELYCLNIDWVKI